MKVKLRKSIKTMFDPQWAAANTPRMDNMSGHRGLQHTQYINRGVHQAALASLSTRFERIIAVAVKENRQKSIRHSCFMKISIQTFSCFSNCNVFFHSLQVGFHWNLELCVVSFSHNFHLVSGHFTKINLLIVSLLSLTINHTEQPIPAASYYFK